MKKIYLEFFPQLLLCFCVYSGKKFKKNLSVVKVVTFKTIVRTTLRMSAELFLPVL